MRVQGKSREISCRESDLFDGTVVNSRNIYRVARRNRKISGAYAIIWNLGGSFRTSLVRAAADNLSDCAEQAANALRPSHWIRELDTIADKDRSWNFADERTGMLIVHSCFGTAGLTAARSIFSDTGNYSPCAINRNSLPRYPVDLAF